MSDGLVERIDELGARIDELEHSITRCALLVQAALPCYAAGVRNANAEVSNISATFAG